MKEYYNIAVIGESMSGKSTWIASLFREDVAVELANVSRCNEEGQTKIRTNYLIRNTEFNKLSINYIDWNEEELATLFHENNCSDLILKLNKMFLFDTGFVNLKEASLEDIQRGLAEFLKCEQYKQHLTEEVDVISFIQEIVNNAYVKETEIIYDVAIEGPANPEIWSIIQKNHLEYVLVRDTRGFLDDSLKDLQEHINHVKENESNQNNNCMDNTVTGSINLYEEGDKNYIQNLLDERGVYGIDACVFMSVAGANALLKANNREMYKHIIQYVLKKCPTFLTIRSDQMADLLSEEDEYPTYKEALKKLIEHRRFSGFVSLEKLLKEFGLFNESDDYVIALSRKHYKKLIIADIADIENDDDTRLYIKSVIGSFSEIIEGINDYLKDIGEAQHLLQEIGRVHCDSMFSLYTDLFDKRIWFEERNRSCDGFTGYTAQYIVERIQQGYYGGLVGSRGGLTTRVFDSFGLSRMVGDIAIRLLLSAYNLRKFISEEAIYKMTEEIEDYIRKIKPNIDDVKLQEDVITMKSKLLAEIMRQLDQGFECLSCTGYSRMVSRKYLKNAYFKVLEELEIEVNKNSKENVNTNTDNIGVGRYLKRFEQKVEFRGRKAEMFYMSVVNRILWYLLILYDPKNQKENEEENNDANFSKEDQYYLQNLKEELA